MRKSQRPPEFQRTQEHRQLRQQGSQTPEGSAAQLLGELLPIQIPSSPTSLQGWRVGGQDSVFLKTVALRQVWELLNYPKDLL